VLLLVVPSERRRPLLGDARMYAVAKLSTVAE
jgi:hypothetical protein